MRNTIWIAGLLLVLASCSLLENEEEKPAQKYLFEVQYINASWAFIHAGLFIDYRGEVHAFRFDSAAQFLEYEKDSYAEAELKEKYAFNPYLLGKVRRDSLADYRALMPLVTTARYTDTLRVGADMGQKMYNCFVYDNGTYKKILLKTEGDWAYQLDVAESDSLVKWLDVVWNRYAEALLSY